MVYRVYVCLGGVAAQAWKAQAWKQAQSDLTQKLPYFFHSNTMTHLKNFSFTYTNVKCTSVLSTASWQQAASTARPS